MFVIRLHTQHVKVCEEFDEAGTPWDEVEINAEELMQEVL